VLDGGGPKATLCAGICYMDGWANAPVTPWHYFRPMAGAGGGKRRRSISIAAARPAEVCCIGCGGVCVWRRLHGLHSASVVRNHYTGTPGHSWAKKKEENTQWPGGPLRSHHGVASCIASDFTAASFGKYMPSGWPGWQTSRNKCFLILRGDAEILKE